MKANKCFFRNKPVPDENLKNVRKKDSRVRECAKTLQDTALLAKLSAGDLVALEAKYHAKCLFCIVQQS